MGLIALFFLCFASACRSAGSNHWFRITLNVPKEWSKYERVQCQSLSRRFIFPSLIAERNPLPLVFVSAPFSRV